MEMHAFKGQTEDMKKIIAFLGTLTEEIAISDGVKVSLSESMVEVLDGQYGINYNSPTGNMTLVVSWKRVETNREVVINKRKLREIAAIVEEEMGYGGLRDEMYERFISDVVERYIAEVA